MSSVFASSVLSLIPATVLCFYIYMKDRTEKEPLSLLLILFGAGAVLSYPAYLLEKVVCSLFDSAFASARLFSPEGILTYVNTSSHISHDLLCAFFGMALAEEGIKWLILILITKKNREFNCLFDGIVYATFVALGFTVVENIRFALSNGWDMLLYRALTTVPLHLFFGIISGFFYTLWRMYAIAAEKEKTLVDQGKLDEAKIKKPTLLFAASLITPVVLHFLTAFTELYQSETLKILFFVIVGVLYVVCFFIAHKLSDHDTLDVQIANKIIAKRHSGTDKDTWTDGNM